MLPAFLCHFPAGSSIKEFLHYGQEIKYGFFGKYMYDGNIPEDFPLHQITAPMSIHYSTADTLANVEDTQKLISKLRNKDLFAQEIHGLFNHIDFLWGKNANNLVYKKFMTFFDKYK